VSLSASEDGESSRGFDVESDGPIGLVLASRGVARGSGGTDIEEDDEGEVDDEDEEGGYEDPDKLVLPTGYIFITR
jgi:hypothetical protein